MMEDNNEISLQLWSSTIPSQLGSSAGGTEEPGPVTLQLQKGAARSISFISALLDFMNAAGSDDCSGVVRIDTGESECASATDRAAIFV